MAAPQMSMGELSKSLAPVPNLGNAHEEQRDGFWSSNPMFTFVNNVARSIQQHRQSLDLINPGTMENINKEVAKDVFLNQMQFSGLRADISKTFAMNPIFQVSHGLSIGGQLPAYSFTAMVGNEKTFFQGTIDNEFSLTGRFNHSWDKHSTSKLTFQLAHGQQPMCQIEHDYQANDFSLNFKTLNPNFLDDSYKGVMVGSILQSITPKLSLGMESVYSSLQPGVPGDAALSFVGRYNAGDWIASAQLQAQGALVASFWRKVAKNVEAGIETTVQAGMQPTLNELMQPVYQTVVDANTTLGAKYEFRQSIYRGQVDSKGQVSFMLEHRVLPTVGLLFSATIDQIKNTANIGCGLSLEFAGSEEVMMMQNGMMDANGNPIEGAQLA
ncbi:hypothetical protein KL905_001443 [Ogataea polymorpha]|nr:hypothetical protein KL937_002834 [Ogataea polymorpha]KAG7893039.1 hypothetical protein KL936_001213 [Ogataea polymorpha]KAG7897036.1 hypothetical protein KL908_000438 [Ogataea polymorpha]KAG7903159.1 hypothetical protein KL935_000691 [Ogataea polymorpha]KAG7912236.1 hypothetical protein KL906_000440 [Ogataea polymorpha]